MPIYTKTGDAGMTGKYGGKRIAKTDPLVCTVGDLDELNAHLGIVASVIENSPEALLVRRLQSDLFSMGAVLMGADVDVSTLESDAAEMEKAIDRMDASLPRLTNFILPGPSRNVADIHVARSVARRAERTLIHLLNQHTGLEIPEADRMNMRIFANRISDFLFVLARSVAVAKGTSEVHWAGKMKSGK